MCGTFLAVLCATRHVDPRKEGTGHCRDAAAAGTVTGIGEVGLDTVDADLRVGRATPALGIARVKRGNYLLLAHDKCLVTARLLRARSHATACRATVALNLRIGALIFGLLALVSIRVGTTRTAGGAGGARWARWARRALGNHSSHERSSKGKNKNTRCHHFLGEFRNRKLFNPLLELNVK